MRTQQGTAQATQQTMKERGAAATRDLREALRLPAHLSDTTLLGTALAEAAAREIRRNPQFASEVRQRYDDLVGLRKPAAKRSSPRATALLPPLRPITKIPDYSVNPSAPPDPQFLIRLYGRDQLTRALQDYTLNKLKQTAAVIEQAHPDTKPTNRSRIDDVIAYIVEYS
jgi:hypothetical protein